jgi:channel protein (hemolysin III family)
MFALVDYTGIYILIAGSYTAIVWNVLRGSWRRGSLIAVWLFAGCGHGTSPPFQHITRLA